MSFNREILEESPLMAMAAVSLLLGRHKRRRGVAQEIDPVRKEIAEHNAAVAARKAEKLARREQRA
jgi:hypothetical protein